MFTSIRIENITGRGIKANNGSAEYFVGNVKLMKENNIEISSVMVQQCNLWEDEAKTVFFFAENNKALAAIALEDRIKENSASAIAELKALGIEIFLVTGDQEHSAKAIAKKAGIMNLRWSMLPSDKYEFVRQLQSLGKTVAVVGDGINDSQALAQADVSIAMGKGSDIAMDVAKMTIISSDLRKIPTALNLSSKTVKTNKTKFILGFCIQYFWYSNCSRNLISNFRIHA